MQDKSFNALTIAGFDGSGGAGIQADLKTFSALGCYGMTVLTALPVQNTMGVKSIYELTTTCVADQLYAIIEDIQIHALKIGMLHRKEVIETVAKILKESAAPNAVLDPVMVAKSGDKLLLPDAISAMKEQLFPLAAVLTPNLMEASEILGRPIENRDQMEEAALELLDLGPQAVVLKGGHLPGDCDDCLCVKNFKPFWFSEKRIRTKNTHGTGCTFSAAIAAFLAQGLPIVKAVHKAKQYLSQAIEAGKDLQIGRGHGPVHHFHNLWSRL